MTAQSSGKALRLLGLCLSMHAILAPLVATPAAAAAADLAAVGQAIPGTAFDIDGTFATAAAAAAAGRSLLHGSLKPWKYPLCPRCKLLTLRNGWWTGHCKKGGMLFTCRRSVTSVARLAAPVEDEILEVPPEDTMGDVGSIIIDGEAPAPYVACAASSDCELPGSEFKRVNGTAPIKDNGTLQARCAFPDAEAAAQFGSRSGVCVCGYRIVATSEVETANGVVANATATTTADSDRAVATLAEVTSRGRDRTRITRKKKDESDQEPETVRVEDFCVRKARRVLGPKSRNQNRYQHVPHAEIGPEDTIARSAAAEDDGPDLTGVVISDGIQGEAVEVFDEDYVEPPAEKGGGDKGEKGPDEEPAPSPPPTGRGRTRSRRRRLLAGDGDGAVSV